jgi:hypothetical protein
MVQCQLRPHLVGQLVGAPLGPRHGSLVGLVGPEAPAVAEHAAGHGVDVLDDGRHLLG